MNHLGNLTSKLPRATEGPLAASAEPQISILGATCDSRQVEMQLHETAQRIVALTAPEGRYLRFHELRLPTLVAELKREGTGCAARAAVNLLSGIGSGS